MFCLSLVTLYCFYICFVPGYRVKMWYVSRRVRKGDRVSAGDFVGTMKNRAAVSRGMINHVHVQLEKKLGGNWVIVDPTPFIC